jgi:hypothetical protein
MLHTQYLGKLSLSFGSPTACYNYFFLFFLCPLSPPSITPNSFHEKVALWEQSVQLSISLKATNAGN